MRHAIYDHYRVNSPLFAVSGVSQNFFRATASDRDFLSEWACWVRACGDAQNSGSSVLSPRVFVGRETLFTDSLGADAGQQGGNRSYRIKEPALTPSRRIRRERLIRFKH